MSITIKFFFCHHFNHFSDLFKAWSWKCFGKQVCFLVFG